MNTSHQWTCFQEIHNLYNNKIIEANVESENKKAKQLKDLQNISPKKW